MGARNGAVNAQKRAASAAKLRARASSLRLSSKARQEALNRAVPVVQQAVLLAPSHASLPRMTVSIPSTPLAPSTYNGRIGESKATHGSQQTTFMRGPPPPPPKPYVAAPPLRLARTPREIRRIYSRTVAASSLYKGYANIHDLRALVDRRMSSGTTAKNAVLVAIDTESERLGLVDHVVEVGLCIVRVSDIYDIDPGLHLRNWTSRMEFRHLVIDVTRKPTRRMRSSLFGPKSLFLSAKEAHKMITIILRSAIAHQPIPESLSVDDSPDHDSGASSTPGNAELILVGQSIKNDVDALGKRPLNMDLRQTTRVEPPSGTDRSHFQLVFDTLALTYYAESRGLRIQSAKLGYMAKRLGVDPKYWDAGSSVLGVHNAVNDAAYTMMLLLLYAVRWAEIDRLPPPPIAEGRDRETTSALPIADEQDAEATPVSPIFEDNRTKRVRLRKAGKATAAQRIRAWQRWLRRWGTTFAAFSTFGTATLVYVACDLGPIGG